MGGGQANKGQATQAAAQQTAASNQDMALSKQYGAQEQQIFNKLFGSNGSGTLSGMMDPKSLNTGAPEGAYKTAWNNAQNNIAQSYQNQRGSLAQTWANRGMGSNNTPSGFQADQQRQLRSSEADTRGGTYTGIVGKQHEDALNNFWNANNIAAGQQGSATSGSTTGSGNAGSSSAALYGTAGQYHPSATMGAISSGIGAAGTVGAAAMCPAEGSEILLGDGTRKPIEKLAKGDRVLGCDGKPDELVADPEPSVQEVCEVRTKEGRVKVSLTHALIRHSGGYALAAKSLGETVDTDHGPCPVLEVKMSGGKMVCFHLFLKRSHGYNANGFWSLE
jgi:hypothetical protein